MENMYCVDLIITDTSVCLGHFPKKIAEQIKEQIVQMNANKDIIEGVSLRDVGLNEKEMREKKTTLNSKKTFVVYRMEPLQIGGLPEVIEKETLTVYPFVNHHEFPELNLGDVVEIDLFPSSNQELEWKCKITRIIGRGKVITEDVFE